MREEKQASDLIARMKNAMKNDTQHAQKEHEVEMIPGARYREKSGRIVTVLRCSRHRVVYQREGYIKLCESSRYDFDRKFTRVK